MFFIYIFLCSLIRTWDGPLLCKMNLIPLTNGLIFLDDILEDLKREEEEEDTIIMKCMHVESIC